MVTRKRMRVMMVEVVMLVMMMEVEIVMWR